MTDTLQSVQRRRKARSEEQTFYFLTYFRKGWSRPILLLCSSVGLIVSLCSKTKDLFSSPSGLLLYTFNEKRH